MTVQIIGGGNLATALKDFDVEVVLVVETTSEYRSGLQVWEMSQEAYDRFEAKSEACSDWDSSKYGWWRNSGSNICKREIIDVEVNGINAKVYKDRDCNEEDTITSFCDLFELAEMFYGASYNENVALIIKDLAELNNMTKAEFVKWYAKVG